MVKGRLGRCGVFKERYDFKGEREVRIAAKCC
jgi:hypothetical protein